MSRYIGKKQKSSFKSTPFIQYSESRSLIWMDMEPLLEKERKKCEQAAITLRKAKQDLEKFELEWQPAFSNWFHTKFGQTISYIAELEKKLSKLEETVDYVEQEVFLSGCSPQAAYDRFEKIQKDLKNLEEKFSEQQQKNHTENDSNSFNEGFNQNENTEKIPPELEILLRMGFETMVDTKNLTPQEYQELFSAFMADCQKDFFKQRQKFEERQQQSHSHPDEKLQNASQSPPPPESSKEILGKQLYRDLARKLHPDLNKNLSSEEKSLWYEVQTAYNSKNWEQLQALSLLHENKSSNDSFNIQSISQLRQIFSNFQRKLRSIQKSLRHAKQEPSWNFSEIEKNPKQLQKLEEKFKNELYEALEEHEINIFECESQIEKWKNPRKKTKNQKRGKSVSFR